MKQVTAVLLGAGIRGMDSYAPYALEHPDELKFVAVAEPDAERREEFRERYSVPKEYCFETWEEVFERPKFADSCFICTQDKMHFEPSMKALEMGYHVLLEKPMSTEADECIKMGEASKKYNRAFVICHVLRYTPFFSTMKKLLDEGAIGRIMSITHNENVGYWHQAHSFVRGHYRNSIGLSPMILAKSCHDMDILLWLAGKDCTKLASFGSLAHFRSECAPAGAPLRCTDGCPHSSTCPYYAPALYLTDDLSWPTSAVSNNLDYEHRLKALKEGNYGRCVYHCDNNVVDHQVVSLQFEDDITSAFTMCAFTNDVSRTIKIMGTEGEIRGAMEKNVIEVQRFGSDEKRLITFKPSKVGHGGGDLGIIKEFVEVVRSDGAIKGKASADVSVQGSLMSFAAEEARITNTVIDMKEFYKKHASK